MADINNILYELESAIKELENVASQIEGELKGVGESYCASSLRMCAGNYRKVLSQISENQSSFGGGGGGSRF